MTVKDLFNFLVYATNGCESGFTSSILNHRRDKSRLYGFAVETQYSFKLLTSTSFNDLVNKLYKKSDGSAHVQMADLTL